MGQRSLDGGLQCTPHVPSWGSGDGCTAQQLRFLALMQAGGSVGGAERPPPGPRHCPVGALYRLVRNGRATLECCVRAGSSGCCVSLCVHSCPRLPLPCGMLVIHFGAASASSLPMHNTTPLCFTTTQDDQPAQLGAGRGVLAGALGAGGRTCGAALARRPAQGLPALQRRWVHTAGMDAWAGKLRNPAVASLVDCYDPHTC